MSEEHKNTRRKLKELARLCHAGLFVPVFVGVRVHAPSHVSDGQDLG